MALVAELRASGFAPAFDFLDQDRAESLLVDALNFMVPQLRLFAHSNPDTFQTNDINADNLLNVPLLEVITNANASVRLSNTINYAANIGKLKVGRWTNVLSNPVDTRLELLRLPGFGAKSFLEVHATCVNFANAILRACEHAQIDLPFQTPISSRTGSARPTDETRAAQPTDETSFSSLADVLALLNIRERETLAHRFGIDRPEKTLEEVGQIYKLTRERIRQIEAIALRKLRTPQIQAGLSKLGKAEIMPYVQQSLHGLPFKSLVEVNEIICENSGFVRLLLAFDPAFLTKNIPCISVNGLTLATDGTVDSITLETVVNSLPEDFSIPRSISSLADALYVDSTFVHASLSTFRTCVVYLGWALDGGTARRRRFVHLVHLLNAFPGRAIPEYDLWQSYRHCFPKDACSCRDLQILLKDYHGFFANLHHLGWRYIGPSFISDLTIQLKSADKLAPVAISDLGSDSSPTTLAPRVFDFFQRLGPLQFYGARVEFGKKYPEYSDVSFGVVLVMHSEFLRFAPGIYGIPEHLTRPRFDVELRDLLRDKSHVDVFLISRCSGRPFIEYLAWSPAQELDWAQYLLDQSDDLRLSALLQVSRISEWPVTAHVKSQWESRKHSLKGRQWTLSPPNRKESTIETEHLYLTLEAADINGCINLPAANAALGWRIETGRVWVLLALLSSSGLLAAGDSWHGSYTLTENGQRVLRDWRGLLFENADVRDFARANILSICRPCGWISRYLLDIALESCEWNDCSTPVTGSDFSEEDILEQSRLSAIHKLVNLEE